MSCFLLHTVFPTHLQTEVVTFFLTLGSFKIYFKYNFYYLVKQKCRNSKKKNELATATHKYTNFTHFLEKKNPEITLNKLKAQLSYFGNAVSNKKN